MRFDMAGTNGINDLKVTLNDGERLDVRPYALMEANHATLNLVDDEGRYLRLRASQETLRDLLIDCLTSMQVKREPTKAENAA